MADAFYIGMDLCSDFTQLSYYNDITREPESVSQLNNKETYLMPNILFHSTETGHWYVGGEASEARFNEDGVIIDGIFENLESKETIMVEGEEYTYPDLFVKMVKLHIDSFLYRYEDATIRKLVISVPEYSSRIYNLLSGLYKLMEVPESAIEITSHLDSGLYYIFNQEQGLWINSVALYDYNADGLNYYRIDISRNKHPKLVTVTHEDYSSQMLYDIHELETGDLDRNTTLRQLALQAEQLAKTVRMQKFAYIPTLAVSFSYSMNAMANDFKFKEYQWTPYSFVGLQLNIPIFSGGKRYHDIKQAQVQADELELQRINTERQLRISIRQQLQSMETAMRTYVAAEDALGSAQKAYDIAAASYEVGRATLTDLDNAQLALTQSRLSVVQSVYSFIVAKATLEQTLGYDFIESDGTVDLTNPYEK